MSQHFLNGTEIGPSLEQVRGEGMPQEMGMDALRLQSGPAGDLAQDEERAGAGERAAARVQEHLRAVPGIEEGAAAGEVAAQRLGGGPPDRHDPLLGALAEYADDPL